MIDLHLLGSVDLRRDDRPLRSVLAGPKRLGLFAYLLLARPRGFQRRDKILPLFWPAHGQTAARNALSNLLYHLRQDLGDGVIVNRGAEELSVRRDRVWCDVWAFSDALDRSDETEALALYRGELLDGFHVPGAAPAFQHWLDGERNRLRRRAAEAAWTLSETAEEQGNLADAKTWAQTAAGFAPCSEAAQTRLIALLKRTGDRASALAAYTTFATRLREEWDLEPTANLTALVDDLCTSAGDGETFSPPPPSSQSVPAPNRPTSGEESEPASFSPTTAASRPTSPYRFLRSGWMLGLGAVVLFGLVAALAWTVGSFLPASTVPATTPRSVAVLPFTALGASDSTDYFSLGMTEEILTRLAQVSALSVTSRTSVMKYRQTEKSIREIGRELGVAAVVEGSVQRVDDRVRITAQLIDARTDQHLWGQSYDRSLGDILALQSEVAVHVTDALQATLLPRERSQLSARRDVKEAAYHLYLRAQYLRDLRDPDGIVRATTLLQESIRQDSSFAPAHAGLAMAYVWSALIARMDRGVVEVTGLPPETAIPQALQSADRALALDSTVVDAHLARALVAQLFRREWGRSEAAFQRALQINPNHSETLQEYGWMHLRLGHIDRALALMYRAVELDPLSGSAHLGLGHTLYCDRQYEAAIRELETALDLDSRSPHAPKYLAHAHLKRAEELVERGRRAEADAHLKQADAMMTRLWGPDEKRRQLFWHAVTGDLDTALALFQELDLSGAARGWALRFTEQQERLLDHLSPQFTWSVFANPYNDLLRDDPRFERIVEQRLQTDIDLP